MEELKDVKISGRGKVESGNYNEIKISGFADIEANCTAEELKVSGSVKLQDNLNAKNIKVTGKISTDSEIESENIHVTGMIMTPAGVKAENIHVSGVLRTAGDITSDDIHISGKLDCYGNIKGSNIMISGVMKAKNVECDNFESKGHMEVEEMLNAENIYIRVHKDMNIGEIGGNSITIKGVFDMEDMFVGNKNHIPTLNCKLIEGDGVVLENINVQKVSCKDITIGKNCTVEEVTYTNELHIDETSKVLKQQKI